MVPLILFVCSGTTCRSPMAEALFRLALRPGAPWRAASAGLAAHAGGRACAEAVQAVAEAGGDLKGHSSQPVTEALLREAYAVIAMTPAQADQLIQRFPSVRDRLFLLRAFDPSSPLHAAVDDPFCGSIADYRRCRDLICEALPGLLTYLDRNAGETARSP